MASLTWTSVFGILVLELIVTIILVIPVPIKVRNYLTRHVNRLDLGHKLSKPILFLGVALFFALADSYFAYQRILAKIEEGEHATSASDYERHHHFDDKERLFKAQRNMYLAGFAFTLLFVIGRITKLMQEHVELEEEYKLLEASVSRPAESASTAPKPATEKKKD